MAIAHDRRTVGTDHHIYGDHGTYSNRPAGTPAAMT
jgi:hypothetical protein